jgi:shikimate kinase
LLESNDDLIISTGGGTPCYFNNHELLQRDDVVSIYLKASIDTLFNRLVNEKHKRPLLAHLNDVETKEFIAKHLFDRSFYYNQVNFKVNVDGKTIVDEMYQLLT